MFALLFDGFAPVQRVRITPWRMRLVQPIAGTDEVVGGGKIGGGIRNHELHPICRARDSRARIRRN